jgi:4-diphosphocytidyl-2-C-methyl-D-erythritol kinase
MTAIHALAPAKVNLGLEVLGRRPDGYHDLVTIMQTVSVFDRLKVTPASNLNLHVADPLLAGAENLVLKAASLFRDEFGGFPGAGMTLTKRIPAAAGLGGASSDAAAALVALARLRRRKLNRDGLLDIAARIGSDVPFLLSGGTALAEGRGDRVTPLHPLSGVWFVLVVPPVTIPRKTATLYAALSAGDFSSGDCSRDLAADLASGRPLRADLLANAFRRPLLSLHPQLTDYERRFAEAGAPFVALSGSGPALFTVVRDLWRAHAIAGTARETLPDATRVLVCRPVSRAPLIRIAGK